MELFLNVVWLTVAASIVWLWLRGEDPASPDRRRKLIAMAVLIAVLFPVISVSDDLFAMQNASEADSYVRRDHLVPANDHPIQPLLAFVAPMIFAGLALGFLRFITPSLLPIPNPQHPALTGVDNRPPPFPA